MTTSDADAKLLTDLEDALAAIGKRWGGVTSLSPVNPLSRMTITLPGQIRQCSQCLRLRLLADMQGNLCPECREKT